MNLSKHFTVDLEIIKLHNCSFLKAVLFDQQFYIARYLNMEVVTEKKL